MRSSPPVVRATAACISLSLVLSALAPPASAQACTSGRLVKNDSLPDVPSGAFPFGVVRGLCDNEAAMSIFATTGAVKVHAVSVLYGHRLGVNNVQALADVEIYDGATLQANGRYVLGPLVFKLSSSSNAQLQSTAINTLQLPQPVRCASGKVVVGFRMLTNLANGSCALGYDANFCVDAGNQCTPGINVLDAIGHGPVDPATYTGFGPPLCPLYIRGSWVIRACIEPEVSVAWTGNPTPGGFVSLQFLAPGQGGNAYLALGANGTASGTPTPWGRLPLDNDPLLSCFLGACRSILLGGTGTINAQGNAFGSLQIPNLPVLTNSGFTIYMAFVTYQPPNFAPWFSVSSPSLPIVIN